ncbi:hypothetical protein CUU66_08425 [Peribacillus deserti]|uniref:Uncharacterized protein n=1 Tax=Peribacillus deserti TaxID=673318 RepID=A0A2N5M7G5_9BACI|nr:hypothetical protein CUU66_08425 [Peribacillus deserti]
MKVYAHVSWFYAYVFHVYNYLISSYAYVRYFMLIQWYVCLLSSLYAVLLRICGSPSGNHLFNGSDFINFSLPSWRNQIITLSLAVLVYQDSKKGRRDFPGSLRSELSPLLFLLKRSVEPEC